MRVSFNIYYPTHWGQTIHLIGATPELGNGQAEQAIDLQYTKHNIWTACVEIADTIEKIDYRYFLKSNGQVFFEPWERAHQADFASGKQTYFLYDTWQEKPADIAFYSSAFTRVLFRRSGETASEASGHGHQNIRIKVFAPQVGREQQLAICGNQTILGNWHTDKAKKMSCPRFPEWEVELDATQLSYPIEYKFIIYSNNDDTVRWEEGANRTLNLPLLKEGEMAVFSGSSFREVSSKWKGAGLVIPVFSLRSKESFGIGDFHDLKKIVDWVRLTGQKVIQTLPINDTTMTHTRDDSYPYNAISIFALHPLYLNLDKLGKLRDPDLHREFRGKQEELNALEQVDYEQVDRYKWRYFKALFDQEGRETLDSEDYKSFFDENKSWLIPYAAYSFLRERYQTSDFRQWGEYAGYSDEKAEHLCDPNNPAFPEIALYYFLQYHAHKQLKEARDYAHTQGVILKGDIPIGISPTSIEAWTEPRYFNMDVSAGAPPDDFSVNGQNWGFPTYNWDEMEKDSYAWWKKRFTHMARYFDAYRIDHILGFFRIWEIPASSVQGLVAYFNPALALSLEEIQQTGFAFNTESHTRPRINGCFLSELLGVYAQEACELYLQRESEQYFCLRPEVDTQQKIQAVFGEQDDYKNTVIKNALFRIANEVLFIPDKKTAAYYHPRINASQTYRYKELNASDRHAFDYMYWDYFYHRQDKLWKEQAYKRLSPLISCTDMLVCGEDLGMIPDCVPEVMQQLQIISLEIERMPKQTHTEFGQLNKIPYHSVCTTSTHDMSTLRAWWKEDEGKTQRYYNQVLGKEGEAPTSCTPEICGQIIENHLKAPAMLALIPLQDWMGIDQDIRLPEAEIEKERINIPSVPRHYWRYRMHLDIENLLKEEKWNTLLRKMIEDAGRA